MNNPRFVVTLITSAFVSVGPWPAATVAWAADPPSVAAKKAPEGALDAPEFFGFDVVEARRGMDGKGWSTSTTLLATSWDDAYARLRDLFARGKEFAPGWKVVGVGKSDQHRIISATLEDPTGQRFSCEIRSREDRVVQVELKAKPYKGSGGRMTPPPAPDRIPPADAVKK